MTGGATMAVENGTASGDAVISIGGEQWVQRGNARATAYGALVLSSGEQFLSGYASATILSGCNQTVWGTGSAESTDVWNGGTQSGGTAYKTLVHGGGTLAIFTSGDAESATILQYGNLEVGSGGTPIFALLNGGTEIVESGGRSIGSTIQSGGLQEVGSGGTAQGATIRDGGTETVHHGGTVSVTVVSSGGVIAHPFGLVVDSARISTSGAPFRVSRMASRHP